MNIIFRKPGNRASALRLAMWLGFTSCLLVRTAHAASFTNGIVASVHSIATDVGVQVLQQGGNAVDATVAVALTLGVVDGENSGIGGGCFILIRRANGEVVAIDGRETAPSGASRDMFVRNGKALGELSQTGALASGVPGSLAAYEYAVTHYGNKKFKDLLLPAAEIAEKGWSISKSYAHTLKEVVNDMARFDASRAIFFAKGELHAGELLKQPDLASTYRKIADQGIDWFYRGPFAQSCAKWMKQNGGLLTEGDFQEYKIKLREPLISTYRGYKIIGFPPPSSGGIHVAQILNILENFDLASAQEPTLVHLLAEAMKLAFADRAFWLGDSDFAQVPRGLIDKEYARALAHKIHLEHATPVAAHGTPSDWQSNYFKKHTTHFCVADSQGNWVACTATVNTSFGSKVVIPGTGVIMNNQMDDFSIQPGVTNFFGLIGAEANAIAPGKRPLSSMSPTLVLKDERPILALGAAGGPKIITQVVLNLIGVLDLGMSPEEALKQPRIHHQWFPDRLMIEPSVPANVQAELRRLGHTIEVVPSMGVSQILARSQGTDSFVGAADPRADGKASGW